LLSEFKLNLAEGGGLFDIQEIQSNQNSSQRLLDKRMKSEGSGLTLSVDDGAGDPVSVSPHAISGPNDLKAVQENSNSIYSNSDIGGGSSIDKKQQAD
jgi:hypothetical protein